MLGDTPQLAAYGRFAATQAQAGAKVIPFDVWAETHNPSGTEEDRLASYGTFANATAHILGTLPTFEQWKGEGAAA